MMRGSRVLLASKVKSLDAPPDALFPLNDGIGFIALVDQMKQKSGSKVVNAARISYSKEKESFDDGDKNLARFLWVHGHTSPYRHSFYTFHWKAPLFVFRQAFKYQVGCSWRKYEADQQPISVNAYDILIDTDKGCSWNEISGRYVALKDEFYVPLEMRGNPPHGNQQASAKVALPDDFDHNTERELMHSEFAAAYNLYRERLNRGVAKEIARMALPQSIYTQAYWTVSLQGIIHFLEQRLKDDAQHEIRYYAEAVHQLMASELDQIGLTKDVLQKKQ